MTANLKKNTHFIFFNLFQAYTISISVSLAQITTKRRHRHRQNQNHRVFMQHFPKTYKYFHENCFALTNPCLFSVLRLGKCFEALYSVLPLVDHPDATIRFTLSLSKISSSLFLLCDHVLWLSRTGLFEIQAEKWTILASKYWLYSITMNLVRDFYEIMRIIQNENNLICPSMGCRTLNDVFISVAKGYLRVQSHKDVMIDTIKNCCDFFIPLTALGYTKLSPSVIGALGVVSSVAGMLTILDSRYKLTPI